MRNNVSKKVKESKEKYFQIMFNLVRSDIKKSWTKLSSLLGRKTPRTSIKEPVVEGITNAEDIQLTEAMNEYFASVGSNLDSELPPPQMTTKIFHYNNALKNPFIYFPSLRQNVTKLVLT